MLVDRIHFCKLKMNPSGLSVKSILWAEAIACLSASVARENDKTTTLQIYSVPSVTSVKQ